MKKLLKETSERSWYTVKEWTTKAGLEARIQKCEWSAKVKELAPSLHDFYTGYVQVPEGFKLRDSELEQKLEVHGGMTFFGDHPEYTGVKGEWAGFDMAHIGDENIPNPEEYAEKECEQLANQIKSLI